jgi:hypothetical protein
MSENIVHYAKQVKVSLFRRLDGFLFLTNVTSHVPTSGVINERDHIIRGAVQRIFFTRRSPNMRPVNQTIRGYSIGVGDVLSLFSLSDKKRL